MIFCNSWTIMCRTKKIRDEHDPLFSPKNQLPRNQFEPVFLTIQRHNLGRISFSVKPKNIKICSSWKEIMVFGDARSRIAYVIKIFLKLHQ